MAQVYKNIVWETTGIDMTNQPTNAGPFTKMENYYVMSDPMSPNKVGIITKSYGEYTNFGTIPTISSVAGNDRGLHYFYNNGDGYIVCVQTTGGASQINAFSKANATWSTFTDNAGATKNIIYYPVFFSSFFDVFRVVDTLYISNGTANGLVKWFSDDGDTANNLEVTTLSDCGGTATTLTGTLTFTQNDQTVTGVGTAFDTEIQKGRWIRKSSSTGYYEVLRVDSATSLELRTDFDEATGPGVEDESEIAPLWTNRPIFAFIWMNKMFQFHMRNSDGAIIGTGEIDTAVIGGDLDNPKRLHQSTTHSSATPAALETYTGSGTGWIDADLQGKWGTAYAMLGSYLLLFSESDYVVYQYNSLLTPAVEYVRNMQWGCISQRTIAYVDDYVIYFTGYDVRKTNGFSDVSIAGDIINDLKNTTGIKEWEDWLTSDAYGNTFPSAVYDPSQRVYRLYVPKKSAAGVIDNYTKIEYTYSIDKDKWIGVNNTRKVGSVIYHEYTSSGTIYKDVMYSPTESASPAANKLVFFGDKTVFDNANTGVIKSNAMVFSGPKYTKNMAWIELWIHIGIAGSADNVVTFSFTPYYDGTAGTAITRTVTNPSTTDKNYYQKVRFPLNNKPCRTFEYELKDTAWTADVNTPISIVGGVAAIIESEGI